MEQILFKDVVYSRIKEMIIAGTIHMGSKISESMLAEMLSANKAPIRDALKRLQAEKLVVRKPKSGTYVFSMSSRDLSDVLSFRYILETSALGFALNSRAELLAARLEQVMDRMKQAIVQGSTLDYMQQDSVFHRIIVEQGDNPFILDSYTNIMAIVDTLRNYFGNTSEHLNNSLGHHRQLIELVKTGDVAAARQLLWDHILSPRSSFWASRRVEDKLKEMPEPPGHRPGHIS